MSAAAAAAAAAPEERPAKKARSRPKRITDFEHTLDTLLNEVIPEDRKMPIELIELMTEYVAPCRFFTWRRGDDHHWRPLTGDGMWFCTHCDDTRPLNKPL